MNKFCKALHVLLRMREILHVCYLLLAVSCFHKEQLHHLESTGDPAKVTQPVWGWSSAVFVSKSQVLLSLGSESVWQNSSFLGGSLFKYQVTPSTLCEKPAWFSSLTQSSLKRCQVNSWPQQPETPRNRRIGWLLHRLGFQTWTLCWESSHSRLFQDMWLLCLCQGKGASG